MARQQLGVTPSRTRDAAEYGTGPGPGGGSSFTSTFVQAVRIKDAATGTQSLNTSGFQLITLPTEVTDTGNNYDPATGLYTVPATGVYYCLAKVRLVDGTSANQNIGVGTHTATSDHEEFEWRTTAGNRQVYSCARVSAFTQGQQLRVVFWTSTAMTVVAGSLSVYRMF